MSQSDVDQAFQKALGAAKTYVRQRMAGVTEISGKDCHIKSIDDSTDYTTITFEWTGEEGGQPVTKTSTMNVPKEKLTITEAESTDTSYKLNIKTRDGEVETPNLKGTKIEVANNPNNTDGVKKIDFHLKNGNSEEVFTTDNLCGSSSIVEPNADNVMDKHERTWKLDLCRVDNDGNRTLIGTTENLASQSVMMYPDEHNTASDYKMTFETLEGTTKTIMTSPNLLGKKWIVGTQIKREVDEESGYIDEVIVAIANSDNLDLYYNSNTGDIFQRVDTELKKNRWLYQANNKGLDNYELWVKQSGNEGKSKQEYFEWLRNNSRTILTSWEKPLLRDDDTLVNVMYYYKVDGDRGEGSAWLNRFYVAPTRDYPAGTYTYYNGIKWLTFSLTSTLHVLTKAETTEYYVLYDERNQRCCGLFADKATQVETQSPEWLTVTATVDKPENAEEVTPGRPYEQLGKLYYTIYLSADGTKDNVIEYTSKEEISIEGYVKNDTFNNAIGTGNLNTTNKNVKDGINELNKLIRTDNNVELNAHIKTDEEIDNITEAINHVESRTESRIKDVDGGLIEYCTALMTTKNVLKKFEMYCKGITDAPTGEDGWGYATFSMSQGSPYGALKYYGANTKKVWYKNCKNGEWDADWEELCANKDIYGLKSISLNRKEGTVEGLNSIAYGNNNEASGEHSFAVGGGNKASAPYAHAEGSFTTASGEGSHAEGAITKSQGVYSHAEGGSTTASGDNSHAQNESTTASGRNSTACGKYTTASGENSIALGLYTQADKANQIALGEYNKLSADDDVDDFAVVLGNGTNEATRSNAFMLGKSGKVYAKDFCDLLGNSFVEYHGNESNGCVRFPFIKLQIAWKKYIDTLPCTDEWGSLFATDLFPLGDWYYPFSVIPKTAILQNEGYSGFFESIREKSTSSIGKTYFCRGKKSSGASISADIIGIGKYE